VQQPSEGDQAGPSAAKLLLLKHMLVKLLLLKLLLQGLMLLKLLLQELLLQ
jgi:hypothetical protein